VFDDKLALAIFYIVKLSVKSQTAIVKVSRLTFHLRLYAI